MNIDILYHHTQKITEATERKTHSIRSSTYLFEKLSQFCKENRFKTGEGFDMAVYNFLNEQGVNLDDDEISV